MANLNAPFGFLVARHVSGGTPNRTDERMIASGLTEDIFNGDLVKSSGDNTIQKAAAGDAIIGVFAGVNWYDPDGSVRYETWWRSGTTTKAAQKAMALVVSDPGTLFQAQTSLTVNDAQVGQLVDLVDSAGDQATGRSRQAVNAGGGTENQFRIERIVEKPVRKPSGNSGLSEAGQYAIVELKCANHELAGATAAIEV